MFYIAYTSDFKCITAHKVWSDWEVGGKWCVLSKNGPRLYDETLFDAVAEGTSQTSQNFQNGGREQ